MVAASAIIRREGCKKLSVPLILLPALAGDFFLGGGGSLSRCRGVGLAGPGPGLEGLVPSGVDLAVEAEDPPGAG